MTTADQVPIRAMRGADAAAVLAIYQAVIDTGNAAFETEAPACALLPAPPRAAAMFPSTVRVGGSPSRPG